jgi:hypothetical protein
MKDEEELSVTAGIPIATEWLGFSKIVRKQGIAGSGCNVGIRLKDACRTLARTLGSFLRMLLY